MANSSAMAFFRESFPKEGNYVDDAQREGHLEGCLKQIQETISGIRIENRNRLACAAVIVASAEDMDRLDDFLTKNALGHLDREAMEPTIIPA